MPPSPRHLCFRKGGGLCMVSGSAEGRAGNSWAIGDVVVSMGWPVKCSSGTSACEEVCIPSQPFWELGEGSALGYGEDVDDSVVECCSGGGRCGLWPGT